MNISALSIRHPVPAVLLFIMLTIFGIIGFNRLQVQNFPDMDLPTVTITASLEGAAPEQLETEVARLRTVEEMLHRAFRYIRALHTYAAGLLAWARAGAVGDPPHPPEMPDGLVLPDEDT